MKCLVELQQLDSKLLEIQRLRRDLPAEMARISQAILGEKERLEEARTQLEALKLQRRKRERDLEVEIDRVKKSQGRLFEVKTNKEYQALLKEIESAKEANNGLEEEILILMEEMDQRANEVKAAEENGRRVEEELSARQESIRTQLGGLEGEEQRIRDQRERVAARVEPLWMGTYNRVSKRHGGVAVVSVEGGTCRGCYVSIPPQLYNEILKGGPVVQCAFCHRFIYHPAPEETVGFAGSAN
jgi:predicted  nucleic acid-binding Zn-ribbon protein